MFIYIKCSTTPISAPVSFATRAKLSLSLTCHNIGTIFGNLVNLQYCDSFSCKIDSVMHIYQYREHIYILLHYLQLQVITRYSV